MPKYRYSPLFIALTLAFPFAFADTLPPQSTNNIVKNQNINNTSTNTNLQKKEGFFSRTVKKIGGVFHKTENNADNTTQDLPIKYPVEIYTGENEMKALLEKHLPLIQYQKKEDLDKEQISYLVESAPNDIRNMLKTEGYFNTKVNIKPQGQGYIIEANLGKKTHIQNVNVAITGDILQDDDLGNYYKNAVADWKLPIGSTFRQEDWSNSKSSVLSAVTRKKYPLAKFSKTQATINPDNQTADLKVTVDSKNPVYFGELNITGNQRYPLSVIQGLAQFKAGDPYDLDKLLDYQQALEGNNHYSGASVQADFDHIIGDRVPVKVAVSEVKRQKFEAGLRFDSQYGLGGSLGYDHYNLFGRGYTGSVYVEADRYQTTVSAGISQPRNSKGHYLTSNIAYSRSTTQKLEKRTFSSGIWHVRGKENNEWRYGLEFLAEDSKIPDSRVQLGRSYATMLTASWKKHNIQSQMRPSNGYYINAKVGTTLGKLLSSAMMSRVHASTGYYFTPQNRNLGTWLVRGNIGYVYTNKKETNGEVPSSLMFRTGGSSTVRGYELDSIGRHVTDSSAILPDRAMMAVSGEYQYPIKDSFAVALFHDIGGVARTFQTMKLKHGTGIGLRWFSPVAPFSFDIAYGHQDKRFRWHISLGTRF